MITEAEQTVSVEAALKLAEGAGNEARHVNLPLCTRRVD